MTPAPKFRMPAEWEPHAATWLAWPRSENRDWPGKTDAVRWAYCEMIRWLTRGERVRLLVDNETQIHRARRMLELANADLEKVDFLKVATNRGWTRDYGPIFVTKKKTEREKEKSKAVVDFSFTGWGGACPAFQKDAAVARAMARKFKWPLIETKGLGSKGGRFVLEGGAIDVNGRGTLITTEECLLDEQRQCRNPGLSKPEIENALKKTLGVTNMIWLGAGIKGDDTHGHIDDICRFVNPTTLVLAREKNEKDPNHRSLAENRERLKDARLENGLRPAVIDLPMPAPLYFGRRRLPASYANFLIANAAVLVPTFNDPNDRVALGILADLFKDRPVVGIHAVDMVLGLGSIHCLTQQEPAG